jgi:hypothetical protein
VPSCKRILLRHFDPSNPALIALRHRLLELAASGGVVRNIVCRREELMATQSHPHRQSICAKGPGPDHSPGAWTMDEPNVELIGAEQAKTLKALAIEARELEAYSVTLTSEDAEVRISMLRAKLGKDKSGAQHKPE